MDGIILFADDNIFEESFEGKLFKSLKDKNLPVLPIEKLDHFETSIKSISTYQAIILDWEFKEISEEEEEDLKGISLPPRNPLEILKKQALYSLIFIYSSNTIPDHIQQELKEIFSDKISFIPKMTDEEGIEKERDRIIDLIEKFKVDNKHLKTSFIWGQIINNSVQKIFAELESADKYWIIDLFKTAKDDGVEPSIEVINLFHNLLVEKVIQSQSLRDAINEEGELETLTDEQKSYAELFRRFIYSFEEHSPIMTGDIFKLDDEFYGILITPECDVARLKGERKLEFLTFKKEKFNNDFLIQFKATKKAVEEASGDLNATQKDKIKNALKTFEKELSKQAFNQPHQRLYFLPCFNFGDDNYKNVVRIDFRNSMKVYDASNIISLKDEGKRICKVNSPYIQDLRQRFLAYKGRVGVPSLPDKLREWLLEK